MAKKSNVSDMITKGIICLTLSALVIGTGELAQGTIYKPLEAPTPANENGVITAEEWGEVFPEIYASYMENEENNYRTDYLEEDPYLKTVYEGFGFAKDYTSAIGHNYTLEDVYNTERPHALANCLTCKTPDFTKLVNDMGVDAYTLDFAETYEQMNESVSCYNCHANEAANEGALVVTHSYVTDALGEDHGIALETLTCGQCHIEYYFDPETKATSMPYDSIAAMDPEAILEYYNEMGYSDWTQESTGTGLLKVQHPELETTLGVGSMHTMLSCADCHMEERENYTSHNWQSPLTSEKILSTCASCHGETDMTAKVAAIQEEITGREKEVGEKLAALKTALADAVAAGTYEEDTLNEVRQYYREAQWYWDFCYVENSEGAHNSALARRCLDNAEYSIDDAMDILGVSAEADSTDAAEAAVEAEPVVAEGTPTPANENGVITAEEWSEVFPEIYESYMANEDNNYRTDYLEEDPYLKTVYEGFGFAKDYTSAIGHNYTLEDVYNTERPHALANCLTCKTPDFTKLVNDMGVDAYTLDFAETYEKMNESVSCYNCHANQAANDGELVITHSYVAEALGEEYDGIALETLTCGQCHIEYYFNPETKATSMPYDDVRAMDPEAILEYYNEMGYSDWTQESTGTGLLKVQHPELETTLGAGSMHATLSCADCHMAEEGDYTSHTWESPLADEKILSTCATCHGDTDMAEKVGAIQEEITGREKEVGEKLAALKTALAEAVASGAYEEEALNEIRQNYRDAQWYWDFCYVENSEGAHNSTLARRCLDTSEEIIDEAMGKFTVDVSAAAEVTAEVSEETEATEEAAEAAEAATEAEPAAAEGTPTPANENGVITAEEWSEVFPEIYESYMANEDNNYRTDYLEEDPYLKTVYEGFGFAKDYTSAIGHNYTLEDVYNTERPHALANCLTCKTPDFTKLVNDMGVDAYTLDFAETYEKMNESVSCYNCHANQAANDGELVITHSYVTEVLGEEYDGIALETLTCGQCHIEYYFNPETKATSMPYDDVRAMDPEAILEYYNEMGYSDWTQESTGTGLLKVQHPELETTLGAGSMHATLSCADCHMAEEGDYTSHTWESPLADEKILSTCATCHGDTDMAEKVGAIQEEITGREKEVGEKLAALKTALAEAVASGAYEEEALNEIRQNYRDAQWYWDFCYVENSEGAHNSTLARRCLDTSEEIIEEAMGKFEA